MARNTLEAVFGALGAGLTGYGRERREREEAEQRRKRESDLMRVQMLGMGFDPEGESTRRSQGLAQAGQLAQAAPQMPGMPGMPNMSAVGRALSQASQDVPLGRSITVGGERFVQPLSRMPETLAQRRAEQEEAREIRGEERALKTFAEQERIRGEREQQEIAQRATAAGRSAGLSPQDRAFQSVLQFARTPIQGEFGMDSRMPTEDEIIEFARIARVAQQAVYSGGGKQIPTPAPTPLSAEDWILQNPKRPNETVEQYQRRYRQSIGAR